MQRQPIFFFEQCKQRRSVLLLLNPLFDRFVSHGPPPPLLEIPGPILTGWAAGYDVLGRSCIDGRTKRQASARSKTGRRRRPREAAVMMITRTYKQSDTTFQKEGLQSLKMQEKNGQHFLPLSSTILYLVI